MLEELELESFINTTMLVESEIGITMNLSSTLVLEEV